MGISVALVVVFVIGPLAFVDRGAARARGRLAWLCTSARWAGFMLIEVSVLQRFVLLLGTRYFAHRDAVLAAPRHRLGSAWSRRFEAATPTLGALAILAVALVALAVIAIVTPLVSWAMPLSVAHGWAWRLRCSCRWASRWASPCRPGSAAARAGAPDGGLGLGD